MSTRLRLLCAFDGSEPARAAIRAAGALLGPVDATILTVRDEPPFSEAAVQGRLALPDEHVARSLHELDEQLAREAMAAAEDGAALAASRGLRATPDVLRARPPWRAIEAAAAGHDAIVCGTRGHGAVGRALLGSTASSLLSRASRPILVVPEDARAPDGPVLVAYDGTEPAGAALRFAAAHAGGRPMVVACAWRSPVRHSVDARLLAALPLEEVRAFLTDYEELFAETARERARDGVELAGSLGAEARARTVESGGSTWRALLELADEEHAAVIACGAGETGPLRSALSGSVAPGLVHHATLPVLVVPREPA